MLQAQQSTYSSKHYSLQAPSSKLQAPSQFSLQALQREIGYHWYLAMYVVTVTETHRIHMYGKLPIIGALSACRIHLGRVSLYPSCSWVRLRLGVYCMYVQ